MITVLGSVNLDLIGRVDRLPHPGETIAGTTFTTAPGGKGANQALAARRAGAAVRMVGAVGTDAFAAEALAALRDGGVGLDAVHAAQGATGVAMILVDDAGENVIAVLPGANGTLGRSEAATALDGMGSGDTLLLQQEIGQESTGHALELALARGVRVILNTAPFLETTAAFARRATITVANETEFALLAGDGAPLEALMRDWAAATGNTIIVTLGPEGARAATAEAFIAVPSRRIDPVDTVGAGDTFCGYLAAGLDAGLSLEAAMRRAAVAASLACLKPGAQPAIPFAADVDG